LVQYCSASPVTKFIPYSATAVTRCGNDNHHYCELYFSNTMSDITFAAQKMKGNGRAQVSGSASAYSADGLSIPGHLWYAPNHLWLDISPDSRVHVGVDGFMARALGPVDRINYVTQRGHGRPTAVLTLAGVDLHIVFPATMMITGTNSSLRNQPGKLSSDPYTLGWLFEGVGPVFSADGRRQRAQAALLSGERAAPWMQEEVRRLVSTLQEFQGRDSAKPQEGPTMADGGSFTEGVLHLLEREEILAVYNEFFSSYAAQRV
jgi:glycine cleavage system H lipoate-binding protein